MPTLIYHITHKDNLAGIVEEGHLLAQSRMGNSTVTYCNIAHQTIQDRRSQTPVYCGPGGHLHDYVPFYFAPRSPMLYAIKMGNVEGCTARQTDIVHLVSNTESVDEPGLEFVFTDGHAIMTLSDFYDDLDDLDEIDWEIMEAKYWRDTLEDPDRKRRRQAEFLVFGRFHWNLIQEIGVINRRVQSEIDRILAGTGHRPPVSVRPNWYY